MSQNITLQYMKIIKEFLKLVRNATDLCYYDRPKYRSQVENFENSFISS